MAGRSRKKSPVPTAPADTLPPDDVVVTKLAAFGLSGPKEDEPRVELPVDLAERLAAALYRAAELQQKAGTDANNEALGPEAIDTHIHLEADTGSFLADVRALRKEAEALREELVRLPIILPKRPRSLPVRTGKPFLAAVTATPDRVNRHRRKAKGLAGVDKEAERLFLAGDYRPLGAYERGAIVGLANIALDAGILEGLDAAKVPVRIVDPSRTTIENRPYVRVPFPGYAEIARRAGAPIDKDGRIPQHITRGIQRAVKKLTTEDRLIAEPVKLRTQNGFVDTWDICAGKWIASAEVLDPSGELSTAERTALRLDVAACTAMLASWVDRPLLADYERAREASGAAELRDDFVALEDYLTFRRNTELGVRARRAGKNLARVKGKRARGTVVPVEAMPAEVAVEVPAPIAATEADRVVVVTVAKAAVWKDMGWTKEAKKRGPKAGQKCQDNAVAWCRARGLLVNVEERDGETERLLVFTLNASTHPDPAQGTLFLPGAAE